ncbi:YnbE family lipoprotein [Desulfopila sp. IMCC35006]|nr:YnbE family lipoprotein [Desulfopila sp. IMCC35006]TKB28481.1 YnbE family lipoprotein [Desulfopila sp. IMCC35006]
MTLLKMTIVFSFLWAGLLANSGCTRHEVEVKPLEIKPIHITIDVNVKVDRALDDFFGDLDKAKRE